MFLQLREEFLQKTPGRKSFLTQESKTGQYVKPVRRGGKLYLYLAEMAPAADGGRQEKIVRRVNEEEARSYGWKGESNGQNQTAELREHETPPAGSIEPESIEPSENSSTMRSMTPEASLKEPEKGVSIEPSDSTKQEVAREPDKEEFTVVPRSRGFYALQPVRPSASKGYVMVKTDDDGVTRLFCGLCPGFTCAHVKFMQEWLRSHGPGF